MRMNNTENTKKEPLIRVSHLKQYFPIRTGLFETTPLKAVDDISFCVNEGWVENLNVFLQACLQSSHHLLLK